MKKADRGPIETPLDPIRLGLLASEEHINREAAKRARALDARLWQLLPLYNVKEGPHQWYHLALALAAKVHKGFQEAIRTGRQRTWDDYTKALLVVEIERVKRAEKCGAVQAAGILSRKEPWRSFLKRRELQREGRFITPDPGEALRKAYQGFRGNKVAAVVRDAFRYHESLGATGEWDGRVREALNREITLK